MKRKGITTSPKAASRKGQAGAYAGGGVNTVDVDDEEGVPEFGEGFELGVEGGVAGDDIVRFLVVL